MSSLDSCITHECQCTFYPWCMGFASRDQLLEMVGNCQTNQDTSSATSLSSKSRRLSSHFASDLEIKGLFWWSPRATSYQVTCCFQKNCPFNTSANQAIQVVWATEKRRDSAVSRAESWRFHPGEHAPKKQSIVPGCSWLLNSVSVFPSISMYFLVAWLSSCDLHLHLLPALMKFLTTHKIRTSPSAPPAPWGVFPGSDMVRS